MPSPLGEGVRGPDCGRMRDKVPPQLFGTGPAAAGAPLISRLRAAASP